MKNELSIVENEKRRMYCSMDMAEQENKKKFLNGTENADYRLSDCLNNVIEIEDVYIEENIKTETDEKTGEVKEYPKYRTIIWDKNGNTYATGSYGIFNILQKIFFVYGEPNTWTSPLKVKVTKKNVNDKQMFTLEVIE